MTTPHSDTYLEPFIEATYPKAYWYAYGMVSYRPAAMVAAEDITQEAYTRLLTKLKHDPSMPKRLGREALATYLLSIVRYLGYELSRDSRHFAEIDAMRAFQEGGQV
jgi:DNA-directed RNA polymerase specialized sigma24 family protein